MNESQKAFEEHLQKKAGRFAWRSYFNPDEVECALSAWDESRKQALEEAVAICEDTPYRGDNYMEGVASCEERIKELIK
jgi:hypothetical protein